MAISKIILNGVTQMDVTGLTATSAQVQTGYSGIGADGVGYNGSIGTGSVGTPTTTKGTVSDHSILVTPSVSYSAGIISSGYKTGTSATVTAAELVSGALSITTNNTYDVTNYASVNVSVSTPSPSLQTKSVSPTESAQEVVADDGYDGLAKVNVGAISSTYVGSNVATQAGSTIVPTESVQVAVDTNTYTTGQVKIGAISSSYVGTGVTRRDSTDLSVSGATVTVPAGYYESQASGSVTTMTLPTSASGSATSGYSSKATISRSTSAQYINIPPGYNSAGGYYTINATPNGSVTAPSTISGSSATVSTGTNTITLSKTVSVTPNVTTAGYISSGTAGNSSVSLTASVTTKGAETITPTTSNQTIASGTYLTGTQTISGDANLVAANIKKDTSIFGVTGTYEGGGGGGLTLLATKSLGTISTSSTSATDTGQTMTINQSVINGYNAIIFITSIDTLTNSRYAATARICNLSATSNVNTITGTSMATSTWHCKLSSTGVKQTRSGTTAYGVYANAATLSNSVLTVTIYQRYNSNSSGTINGSFTLRAYGLKYTDYFG